MTVSATNRHPTSLVSLGDGSTTLEGQIARLVQTGDGQVVPVNYPTGLTRNGVDRSAVRTSTSGSHYAGLEYPWSEFAQEDWSGGRGIYYFEDDKSRFQSSHGVLSHVANQLTLAGLPHYSGGQFGNANPLAHHYQMPGHFSDDTYRNTALYDSDRYIGRKFIPQANVTVNRLLMWVGQYGTAPGNLRVDLYDDSGFGTPGTSLANGTLTVSSFGNEEIAKEVIINLSTSVALTASTTYWYAIRSVTNGSASNHWYTVTKDTVSGTSVRSSDGVTWGEVSPFSAPYFAALDRYSSASSRVEIKFFEYKRCLYCVRIPESSNTTTVYRNGWRGCADSNSGALTKLKDSTQTDWQNYVSTVGAIVLIIKGPGANEYQPWRTVTSASSGELTVDRAWEIEHTTDTEYVILGTDVWNTASTFALSGYVNVHVAGDAYFLTFENTNNIRMIYERNVGGTWGQTSLTVSSFLADKVTSIREPETGRTALYGYNNDYLLGPSFWKAYIPPAFGYPYTDKGLVQPTNIPFNTRTITNVTQRVGIDGTEIAIGASFSTGMVATKDLDEPVTIGEGTQLGFLMKSNVVVSAGNLTLKASNRTYADQQARLADSAIVGMLDRLKVANKVTFFDESANTHTDKPKAYDGVSGTNDAFALTSDDSIFIVSVEKFDVIYITIGTQSTANVTMTGQYFNGEVFVDHAITDNTKDTNRTLYKSEAVTFNAPGDWQPYTVSDGSDSATGYVFRLKFNGSVSGGTTIAEISVRDSEAINQLTLTTGRDTNPFTDEAITFKTSDALNVGYRERFDRVQISMGDVPNAATPTSFSAYYFNGEKLVTTPVLTDTTRPGTATLAQTGIITITVPTDWERETYGGASLYWLHLQVSADLTEDIQILEVAVYLDEQSYTLDATLSTANLWTWKTLDLTPGSGLSEEMVLRNLTFTLNTDLGSQTIALKDGIRLIKDSPDYKTMDGYRATNIVSYGTDNIRIEPYLFFESQRPHRIDTLNQDALVPILVTAIDALASEANGKAACHSGVYLYFNLGPRLQRYFEGSIESVGPDLDQGLPNDLQGNISCVIPYPGDAVIYAVDAASRDAGFTSSVYMRAGSGTHELYRAPRGEPIRNLSIQVTPGLTSDRLWISVGSQILYIPLPSYTLNPLKDLDNDGVSNFSYRPTGVIDLGYVTDGMRDVVKIFQNLKLVMRGVDIDHPITAYYKAGNASTWTRLPTTFTDPNNEGVQTVKFTEGFVNTKKLAVRLRFNTTNGDVPLSTPVVEAVVVSGVTIQPAAYSFPIYLRIEDYPQNLQGRQDNANRAEDFFATLDSWRDAGTVLTFRNLSSPYDNLYVIILNIGSRVTSIDARTQKEAHYVQVDLLKMGVVGA